MAFGVWTWVLANVCAVDQMYNIELLHCIAIADILLSKEHLFYRVARTHQHKWIRNMYTHLFTFGLLLSRHVQFLSLHKHTHKKKLISTPKIPIRFCLRERVFWHNPFIHIIFFSISSSLSVCLLPGWFVTTRETSCFPNCSRSWM